jgi:hypothetical protein
MNLTQPPPHSRAENAYSGLKSGTMGEICKIVKNFSRAGERKRTYEHTRIQSIAPILSLGTSNADYLQNQYWII